MSRRYTAEEIAEFELAHGVRLPVPYSEYLAERGAGPGTRVSLLEEWCQPQEPGEMPAQFLERAFPHSDPWNDTSLLDASLGWDAPYFSRDLACGAIRVANAGCERYVLLAVAGPQHGMVWVDARADRAGIYPLRDRGGEAVSCRAFLRRRTPFRP